MRHLKNIKAKLHKLFIVEGYTDVIALDKAKEVGHIDEVFEKLASNLRLITEESGEVEAV